MIITIDTNILIRAFVNEDPYHRDVTAFVSRPSSMVGMDTNNVILNEYQKNLGRSPGFQKWLTRLWQKHLIHQCDGSLPNRHSSRLREYLCGQSTDQTFIGVAFNSDKILISEDSDVGKGPKGCDPPHCHAGEYLAKVMGIQVYDAEEAYDSFWP